MKNLYQSLCTLLLVLLAFSGYGQELQVQHLSTYATGIFDEGAAEIVAHDPETQRLFFTNADAGTIDVLDIADPANPVLINQIDISAYGDGVNSVAVSGGMVAAAVENEVSTEAGFIVVFDADGTLLKQFDAGVLPDMVTFSPDGTKILSANEGEPDDDYLIDPEGSVTIVDISAGLDNATVTQVTFEAYNDKKATLLNKGVRLFGPNASVAQDLEPEYIAITADNTTAYVSMQENNAVGVIDIIEGKLMDILPLGYKDHYSGEPVLEEYRFDEIPWWPALGTPAYGGPTVDLGGFSGLWYDQLTSNSQQLSFYVVPDRGPNEDAVSSSLAGTSRNLRPFKLPDYQARIDKLILITGTNNIFIDANPIYLTRQDGVTPISGRGNIPGVDEIPVTYTDANVYTNEDYVVNGNSYHELEYDAFGGDFEGVLFDRNRNIWLCDENRPAIYKFDRNGVLIERFVPEGTSMLGDTPQPEGYYGAETLPAVYNKKRANRGFEAIAWDYDENIIYAFIQSPIENPSASAVRNNSDVIRILGINPEDGTPVKEFVYLLERNKDAGVGLSRTDKIGDAVYVGNGIFMVLERDSSTPADGKTGRKYIFQINTTGATNIVGTPLSTKETSSGPDDKTLEMMTADDLAAAGIVPVHKNKVLNLPSAGYHPSDKAEGIAVLPNGDIAVMNDNDFGLAGAGVSDAISLGIFRFQKNYGFDASNESETIEIIPRPTLGMYQPDAITSFTVDGQTFIATANEGDARDYDGYSEEDRVKDLTLDPTVYPDAATLQEDTNLGRLLTTTANGDFDGDGDVDQVYSYGARSFSIWDANGNLVFDSGDQFEQITAELLPDYFNSQGDDNLKNRSDDKGPEPEAIAVSEINGELYAIIGLERIGGFMVYNISDPLNPHFVTYFYNRDFSLDPEDDPTGDVAPEDIIVIKAEDSPNGQTLLVSSAEVSGTISIFSVEDGAAPAVPELPTLVEAGGVSGPTIYPNPVIGHFNLSFEVEQDSPATVSVYDQNGKLIMLRHYAQLNAGQQNINYVAVNWPAGNYFLNLKTAAGNETLKLMKIE